MFVSILPDLTVQQLGQPCGWLGSYIGFNVSYRPLDLLLGQQEPFNHSQCPFRPPMPGIVPLFLVVKISLCSLIVWIVRITP